MSKRILALGAPLALLVLAGCHQSRAGVFAQGHRGVPNEFIVGRAAPLTVPPDFALVPPRPGAPRPQEADSSTQALATLFGGQQKPSEGEAALLQQAGAGSTPPGIRSEAGSPDTDVVNKGATTRDILNAPSGTSTPAASAVTPAQADAMPTTPTPVASKKKK